MLWRSIKWLGIAALLSLVLSFVTVLVSTYYYSSKGFEPALGKQADVILVLSAGLDRSLQDFDDGFTLLDSFSRDRVATAVDLWKRGAAPRIVMSGGIYPNIDQHVGEHMKQMAIDLYVPEYSVDVEGYSTSTFENTRYTLQLARQQGWQKAILVTDDFHILRAQALFDFWHEEGDLTIVAAVPALGRETANTADFARMIGRETLALPYNIGKVALQLALSAVGLERQMPPLQKPIEQPKPQNDPNLISASQ